MIAYKCNDWTFNPTNQELLYDDGTVKQIPTRISVCLNTLIESQGITVTYDELLNKVWGTTHKDSSTISSVISELRKRIGCGKDGTKLLVTIPKKGYRFTGEVTVLGADTANDTEIDKSTDKIEEQNTVASVSQTQPSQSSVAQVPLEQAHSVADGVANSDQSPVAAKVVAAKVVAESASEPKVEQQSEPQNKPEHQVSQGIKTSSNQSAGAASAFAKYGLLSGKSMLLVFLGMIIAVSASLMSSNFSEQQLQGPEPSELLLNSHEILTHKEGAEIDFDVSSDGRWLIYTYRSLDGQKPRIFLKDLHSGHVQGLPVEGEGQYESPSFSDDLSRIAYIRNTDESCEIWVTDFSNLTLESASNRKVSSCGLGGVWSTTGFSKDGHVVYFSRSDSLTEPFRIYRHDLRTGYERNITAPTSSGRGDYSFALSPDGKQLAIVRNLLWQSTSIQIKNLEDGSSRSLIELPYLIERVDWLSDDTLAYRGENWQLVSHQINNNERKVLANVGDIFNFVVTSKDRIYAYKGTTFGSNIWSLTTSQSGARTLEKLVKSRYLDKMPIKGPGDSLFFISNRSGKTQLWKSENGSYSPLAQIELPRQAKNLHFSEQQNAFYGVSEKRLFRIDLVTGNLEWLSSQDSQIYNVTLSDDNSLIYSEDMSEQWFLKSLNLTTLVVTDLGINGFGAKQVDGNIYYTRYREQGLWRYNINTKVSDLLIKDFDSPLTDYWGVYEGQIYHTAKGRINVYALNNGRLLDDSLEIEGFVRNIRCFEGRLGCVLGIMQPDETEIFEFKP